VGQRRLVTATLGLGQLAGAFVELRRHLSGFLRRTTEGHETLGELVKIHVIERKKREGSSRFLRAWGNSNYLTESAGTILMLSMFIRLTGTSRGPVGVVPIFSSTSSPLISLPNAVY